MYYGGEECISGVPCGMCSNLEVADGCRDLLDPVAVQLELLAVGGIGQNLGEVRQPLAVHIDRHEVTHRVHRRAARAWRAACVALVVVAAVVFLAPARREHGLQLLHLARSGDLCVRGLVRLDRTRSVLAVVRAVHSCSRKGRPRGSV